ncbi:unnamed protein product, partial [Ectocarpus sp. 12 AP-2014]
PPSQSRKVPPPSSPHIVYSISLPQLRKISEIISTRGWLAEKRYSSPLTERGTQTDPPRQTPKRTKKRESNLKRTYVTTQPTQRNTWFNTGGTTRINRNTEIKSV